MGNLIQRKLVLKLHAEIPMLQFFGTPGSKFKDILGRQCFPAPSPPHWAIQDILYNKFNEFQ